MAPSRSAQVLQNPENFEAGMGVHAYRFKCKCCTGSEWVDLTHACRHEKTYKHARRVAVSSALQAAPRPLSPSLPAPGLLAPTPPPGYHGLLGPLKEAIASFITRADSPAPPVSPLQLATADFEDNHSAMELDLDWDQVDYDLLMRAPDDRLRADAIAANLAAFMDGVSISSDEEPAELDEGIGLVMPDDPDAPNTGIQYGSIRPVRNQAEDDSDPRWFPWPDKETCLLDIMRRLPRSKFSDSQMESILWMARSFGVDDLPSVKVLKSAHDSIKSRFGVPSIRQQGRLGHIYYLNDLGSIIAQEMANPRIRPHLHFYPEDAGKRLEQAWQASRWRRELDPTLATPMIRQRGQDFYILEPAKLSDGRVVVPERWFTRRGPDGTQRFFACVWPTARVTDQRGATGYVVYKSHAFEIDARSLLLPFPTLLRTFDSDGLPDPRNLFGIHDADGHVSPWVLTDPSCGNPWRERAKGHRVKSFMMWLYCDDTSGNVSKKWNKHNSFLFTAAGLPRTMVHQESNIHFLTTSNLAPPLEMLDGIADQLEQAQATGIWAWDCEDQEMVLLIPVVLAVLGDNPMQSELACHVGMKGKFFCRNCWVKGHDAQDNPEPSTSAGSSSLQPHADTESDGASIHSASDTSASEHSTASNARTRNPKRKKRAMETLAQLITRTRRFIGSSTPRHRDESIRALRSMFSDVVSTSHKTNYRNRKTATGLKDTFMEHFVNHLFARPTSRTTSDAVDNTMPVETYMSPIWRIRVGTGLDPHQDTPVEILHVILLGFVKYLWRDATTRMNSEQKQLLIVRLNSTNVSGLGIPRLAGQTLVQFAGSLTGRDFRAISQVAPFVLQGLVPPQCYDTFVALSALVPLVWQPQIEDIDVYLDRLKGAVDHFLLCTARWTPRWFNKPKFHILLHLAEHVRRFGPAILFATEGFESFNALIREASVHSNHLAPSRDIARSFASINLIRHIISGGFFLPRHAPDSDNAEESAPCQHPFSTTARDWLCAGSSVGPLVTIEASRNAAAIAFHLGAIDEQPPPGTAISDGAQPHALQQTCAWARAPHALSELASRSVKTCKQVISQNGDVCRLSDFVLAAKANAPGRTIIGRLSEILQVTGSVFVVSGVALPYHLPSLARQGWLVISAEDVVCSVNVQHNCAAQSCSDSGVEHVREEREVSDRTRRVIVHRVPDALVLNTAQMRDAIHVQRYRLSPEPIDREHAIKTGAEAEIASQRVKNKAQTRAQPPQVRKDVSRAPNLRISTLVHSLPQLPLGG
ncbi:hypothetical protein CONPUDRAFT_69138 [Coniophora puteana RWD-64-598 SS2]|uniref:Uncharacterized protein n=1 Tax=Coniophora puteana (strain RWD-64-598) TaxID=741705 RepID=A0A5M3N5V5_CONPW|nr:uncharacterized protein CONPUDRAFT_69138 [Coniophora puteana RWD-64-598 SS2]EIW86698.1 hypothetical protein CONPUDRAFT_69138 [Coniophora puteana RWD-64-598 SS2]